MKKIFLFFVAFLVFGTRAYPFTWSLNSSMDQRQFNISKVNIIADTSAAFIDFGIKKALTRLNLSYDPDRPGYTLIVRLNHYEPPRNVEMGEVRKTTTDINTYGDLNESLKKGASPVVRGLVDVFVPEASVNTKTYSRKIYDITAPTLNITLSLVDDAGKEVYSASRLFNAKSSHIPGRGLGGKSYFSLFNREILDPAFSCDVAITEMFLPMVFSMRGNEFFVKKNPRQAYWMSWVVPGSGKIYAGKVFSGIWDIFIDGLFIFGIYSTFTNEYGTKSGNIIGGITLSFVEILNRWRAAVGSYNAAIEYNYKKFFMAQRDLTSFFER